ncbi:MAG: hypothetical protein QG670_916, partial [Thermoproteota archaeon]|nr:hypothetical protein [Thermoproteota archaeon]
MSALAYTPGLKRKAFYKFVKERKLPIAGDIQVKVGDKVSFDTIIVRAYAQGDPLDFSVALQLGCEAENVPKYLLKKVGDKIKKDEPIARMPGPFSFAGSRWGEKVCLAPCDGVIEYISSTQFYDPELGRMISTSSGRVLIRKPPVPIELDSYIPGTVVELLGKEGVAIECPAAYIQGILGIGGETHGKLSVISKSSSDTLTADEIGKEQAGQIIVGGGSVDVNALRKAIEVGVKGIIVGGVEAEDLNSLIGYRIGVAITGNENIGLTLIMTEGFGKMTMAQNTFEL